MKHIKKIVVDVVGGIVFGLSCGFAGWLVSELAWTAATFITNGG